MLRPHCQAQYTLVPESDSDCRQRFSPTFTFNNDNAVSESRMMLHS